MSNNCHDHKSQLAYSNFKKISISEDWFDVYQIDTNLFVFHEACHYEKTIANLLIGQNRAVLIDTGCGIGNLRQAVEDVTAKPVTVINTHTHPDHLGSNNQFDEILMFDHPVSHSVATKGIPHQIIQTEILDENLVIKPWPKDFDPQSFEIPPFKVDHWLKDGERTNLDNFDLEVIHTPGEAVDHICILDRTDRLLFCGDILLHGEVWTHLEGGNLKDLTTSYKRLMGYLDDFDYLMPSHNEPWIDKNLLLETLAGAEKVVSGEAEAQQVIDPWNRRIKRYSFGRFLIITK